MRPTWSVSNSVNHRKPSGPAAIPMGVLTVVGKENSVTAPPGVMRPMRSMFACVNQTFPSGPAAMPSG
jgi:hypothetical protein